MTPGFKNAVRLFKDTAHHVPAYRRLLERHHLDPKKVYTLLDFKKMPIIDKASYIYSNDMKSIFFNREVPPIVYASSGSSGHPTFWFRGDVQEAVGAEIHEPIFRDIFGVNKEEPTLVVICFSMGIWVAGNYTLVSCRGLAEKGYRLTIAAPGLEMDDILNTLRYIAPQFKRLVLAGYPPFIMDVVSRAVEKKIKIPNSVKILTAGDKFSEEWRSALAERLGVRDPLRFVVSIYGSADAGIMGYETPLSIFLRRAAAKNKDLRLKLLGDDLELPALVQYDPDRIFFEEINGELLFTTNTAAPLIRYNIHDVGKVIDYMAVEKLIEDFKLMKQVQRLGLLRWRYPFIVKRGRNDVAVTFYALNIYPENIKAGLVSRGVSRFVSGQFFAFHKNVAHEQKEKLYINVELAKGVRSSHKVLERVRQALVENLIKYNIEYRKLHTIMGANALPNLKLIPFGSPYLEPGVIRGVALTHGKKAKMV